MTSRLLVRQPDLAAVAHLSAQGVHPVLARIFASRGITDSADLDLRLAYLHPWQTLLNADVMAERLADAIARRERILVVADYDSDGATACAVAQRGLRAFGATVDFLVPNRFTYGYGLTPEIVALAAERKPHLLLTVDNGIASCDGVAAARQRGIEVLVTDHHLPGAVLPEALIVNPNQPGCAFPSKNLAGVGVMFYLLIALRAEARRRGWFSGKEEPNLAQWLDLVALGTVADVVPLDRNNRILVHQGLLRMRQGAACAGIRALFQVAGRNPIAASTFDLGFMLGPRLNAAGRLDDMSLGISALLSEDNRTALALAQQLDQLNRERRSIEADMQDIACAYLDDPTLAARSGLALFDASWHQGVIGILASRIKDRQHRPVIAFAPGNPGELKGSGRSIAGLHLRDALDLLSKRHPHLLKKFGGHAAAAGLTIASADFPLFSEAFDAVCRESLSSEDLARAIVSDGTLTAHEHNLALAHSIRNAVWGQGFAQPQFHGQARILEQRVVGGAHTKLKLDLEGCRLDGIFFRHSEPVPAECTLTYHLEVNEYLGAQQVQVQVTQILSEQAVALMPRLRD